MAITVDWENKVINIPKSFMTFVSPILYNLDVNALRIALKDLEDDIEGMPYDDTHRHNSPVVLAGVTYARAFEVINGYTVTFEDGQYVVSCSGANHNLSDVKTLNQVSLVIGNAAGLVQVSSGGGGSLTASEVWTYNNRVLTSAAPPTSAQIVTAIDATSTKLDVPISTRLAASDYTVPPTAGANATAARIEMDANSTRLTALAADMAIALGDLGQIQTDIGALSIPTAAAIAADVWSHLIEAGYSAEEILKLIASYGQGNATGLESGSPVFKSIDGTKNRITATYLNGVRTVTARDVT